VLKKLVAAILLASLFAIGAVAEETTRLGARYQVVHGWPELPPGEILGQATGVDIDSRGRVWVFHRAGREWSEPFPVDPIPRATVWVFDAATGRRLESWGAGLFVMPHGITIDAAGRVLVADRSNSRIQVFDQVGRFLAQWQSEELGRPYAVDPAPGGRVFVADGGDQPEAPPDRSGVAITDAEGRMLARFGRFGNQDGQFRLAHDLAVASDGAVYVVDAWGQRVQKFIAH
jgi:peptidylamidoglycolate lyase